MSPSNAARAGCFACALRHRRAKISKSAKLRALCAVSVLFNPGSLPTSLLKTPFMPSHKDPSAACPPLIDLAALAAFNPDLAAGALAQAYADGHRDVALEWAPSVDFFQGARLRPDSAPRSSLPSENGIYSLFTVVVAAGDVRSLEALASISAKARHDIYCDKWRFLCMAAGHMLADPATAGFARHVIDNISPEPPEGGYFLSDQAQLPLSKLASHAVAAGQANLLPKLNQICEKIAYVGLCGAPQMAIRALEMPTPDLAGLAAILDLPGFLDNGSRIDLCQKLVAYELPEAAKLGLEALRTHLFQTPAGPMLALEEHSCSHLHSALFLDERTPVDWLRIHLDAGLNPFLERSDSRTHLAARLLSNRGADLSSPQSVAANRQREDLLLPLLEAMIDAYPSDAGARFSPSHVGLPEQQTIFRGVGKIDALLLCATQGFFKAADLLISRGACYKFAARQCSAMIAKATTKSSPAAQLARSCAHSYFEALALRDSCLRSSRAKRSDPPAALSAPKSIRL